MKKRYFWAIDLNLPATLHRFPTRATRTGFIQENPYRGVVGIYHPAFWLVRRINRKIAAGEQVEFPVKLDG